MPSANAIATIILAAGKGTRMKSKTHKVLHPVGGKPMLGHLLDTVDTLKPTRQIMVLGSEKEQVEATFPDVDVVVQSKQLGTGHAVMMAEETLKGFQGKVLILYGDVPLIPSSLMEEMLNALDESTPLVVLGFEPKEPASYGRLITNSDRHIERIVEYKDATESERAITLCNSGMMAVMADRLFPWLVQLTNTNAAEEYYLTDLVAKAREEGETVGLVKAEEHDVLGVNSRNDLAVVERAFQQKMRERAMENGATLIDPASVFFSHDTVVGSDVTIEPNVFFGPDVIIADGVTIKANSHIEGSRIDAGATIGPFARLRPGANIGAASKIGNFVEIKKATLHANVKVSHLSYIGDAEIGAEANIGAGTITCNYDGFLKHQTIIGSGAFIGSNTALVAPVEVGENAMVGAGSVITQTVDEDALALTRTKQKAIDGYSARFRKAQAAKKAAKTDAQTVSKKDKT